MNKQSFVVYRRSGGRVTPHEAWLRQSARGWADGKPVGVTVSVVVGQPISWAELYAGHTQWIADQLDRRDQAIKAERVRRAARRAQGANKPSGTQAADRAA